MSSQSSKEALKRWLGTGLFVVVLAVAAVVFRQSLVAWFSGESSGHPGGTSSAAPGAPHAHAGEIDHYTCPMHPSVKQAGPGKCPICGMNLVPVTKDQLDEGIVMIDDARRQLIGVRTGPVIEGPMQRSLRAVGRVTYDESKLTDVTLKVGGFITKLLVSRTGQRVQAGQTLFSLYSPELFAAQQDFLLASQGASGSLGSGGTPGRVEMLGRAARTRLKLLGLGDAEIDALAKRGTPSESLPFPSPASGFVIEKDVVEGASVQAGMRLFRIAALDRVWVEADVYEADLPHVHVGDTATVTLDYLPGQSYDAKVSYIYPVVDPTARTGKIRVELANKKLELRPGMYANVNLASNPVPRVQVPASAVVYTGPRRLVFVDLGDGRFRPQEVHVGATADGMVEVLDGLKAGDQVATSGVFLIAAEARISTAAKYWDKSPEPAASASPGGSTSPASGAAPAPEPQRPGTPSSPPARAPRANPASASGASSPASTPSAKAAAPDIVWTCPMHPEVQLDKPGECPKCGMTLVPKPRGGSP
jgi:Cu(I)/Ag(I) efflux system membrane fusion protein